jgi:serine/threonine-protein kinase
LPEGFARDETVRGRFGDEARVLASLTHPHIVPVYDYVEEDGVCLLVMEALPGGTVWDRFISDGLSMPTACAVVLATCAGLAHAHDHRVLHRDIKPENLMFDAENTLKVTDFGIATVLGGDESLATADGEIIGTPAYMAPEQAEGGEIGPAADVYAVGTMLYELLSGRLPFDESGEPIELLRARIEQEPKPLDEVAPHVPAPLVAVTMKAIERRPEDRYANPEDLGVAVATAASTAWTPDWKTHSDLRLMTTGRIADATIATSTPPLAGPASEPDLDPGTRPDAGAAPGTVAPGEADGGVAARGTVAPGEGDGGVAARGTVGPGEGDGGAAARGTVGPGEGDGGVGARGTVGPGGADDAAEDADGAGSATPPAADGADLDQRVTPAAGPDGEGARRSVAVDLVDAKPDDLVQVADVLEPPEMPWWGIAATVVLALAVVLIALTGVGEPDRASDGLTVDQIEIAGVDPASTDPVEIDLEEPIPIVVNDPPAETTGAELALSAMGIPLGTSDQAGVQAGPEGILTAVSASTLRVVPSGPVTAELRLLDDGGTVLASSEFGLESERNTFLTAGGIITVLLVLIVFAYGASSSAALRKGRRDRLAYPKLAVVGVLAGVAATLVGWSFAGVELTAITMIVTAVLGGAAAVLAGWCAYVLGRRRRLKQVAASS